MMRMNNENVHLHVKQLPTRFFCIVIFDIISAHFTYVLVFTMTSLENVT